MATNRARALSALASKPPADSPLRLVREAEQLTSAVAFPMLLPVDRPRFLVCAAEVVNQLVRIDMAAATSASSGARGGTAVFQFSTAPFTAAVSADGRSLCVSQGAHLLVFDTVQLLAAGPVVDDPAQSLQPQARTAEPTAMAMLLAPPSAVPF